MPMLDSKAAGMTAGLAAHLGMREPTPEEVAAFEAKLGTEPRHCHDYIDDPAQPECLRRFLDYQCRPAALKYPTGDEAFDRGLEERLGMPMWRDPVPVLFARHEGCPVRVTMASRFGDVGITEHLDAEHGYGKRVAVEDLTDFSDAIVMSVDCAQGSNPPEKRVTVQMSVDWNAPTWAAGTMGSPGGPVAVKRHNEALARFGAPEPHQGNRAQRRAAAARARRS